MELTMNLKSRRVASFVALGMLLAVGLAALALSGTTKTSEPARKTTPPPQLTGTVSASGQVTLTASDGHAVTRLSSGRYTVLITVSSNNADFQLTGPAVQHTTSAHFTGIAIWGVDFVKGTYRYGSNRSGGARAHVISVY
jgi:hypothetical protein